MSGRAHPKRPEAQMMGLVGENEICVGTRFLGRRAPQMSGRTCPWQPGAQMVGLAGGMRWRSIDNIKWSQ